MQIGLVLCVLCIDAACSSLTQMDGGDSKPEREGMLGCSTNTHTQQQAYLDAVRVPLYEVFKELLSAIEVAQVVLGHSSLGHYPVTVWELLRQTLHCAAHHWSDGCSYDKSTC